MTSTRTRRPVLRSAVLAIAFSGAALGGFASTAGASSPLPNTCQINPASCTIATAPPVIEPNPGSTIGLPPVKPGPGPKVTTPPVIKIPTPCTHGCGPDKPGDSGDEPLTDKPRGEKPKGDKPGDPGTPDNKKPGLTPAPEKRDDGPKVETSSVGAPVVATATFTG